MIFIARPEHAETARKIIAALVGVNDEISDEALSMVVGQQIAPTDTPMKSALRSLERSNPPIHFRRIRKIGWKRMNDPDLVTHSETDLKKIYRAGRRGHKKLGHAQFDNLSNGQQLQAARNSARFAAIENAASVTPVRPISSIPDLKTVLEKIKEQAS